MAKTSKINKNELRKKIVAKYAKRRTELKKSIRSIHTSAEDRIAAQETLAKLPRDANPIRVIQPVFSFATVRRHGVQLDAHHAQ